MNLNHKISRLKPQSTSDLILKAFLAGKLESLSEEHQNIFNRWEKVNDLIRGRRLKEKDIVAFLMQAYQIKRSQAYIDIAEAKLFFGIVGRDQVEYKRGVYIEWLEELYRLARASDDYKTALAAIDKAAEIQGMKERSPDLPNYEELQPFSPTITYDKSLISTTASVEKTSDLRAQWEKNRKKTKNIVDDIDYEDA